MKTLAALTAAVILFGTAPAGAQVRHFADLVVVDSRDRVVGNVINLASQPGSPVHWPAHIPVIVLRQGGHLAALYVHPTALGGDGSVMFKTSDCTGTAYVRDPSNTPTLFQISAVYAWSVYQARSSAARRTATIRSVGGALGECEPPSFSGEPVDEEVYPAVRIIDFSGRWVPPFRIRMTD